MEYEIGDRIQVTEDDEKRVIILVTDKEEDIKNGEPGWEGVRETTGTTRWGYDSQIDKVLDKKSEMLPEEVEPWCAISSSDIPTQHKCAEGICY